MRNIEIKVENETNRHLDPCGYPHHFHRTLMPDGINSKYTVMTFESVFETIWTKAEITNTKDMTESKV